ncbi:MAG: trehalose-phosphatase [Acidobacteria bacterium]|nr:MAG: trehalose-phosphatase [Acidobacteriota bacterium]
MRNLWPEWPRVRSLIATQRRVLFLLDFDGTLAPLAGRHDEAVLPEAIRSLLSSLQGRPRAGVAILSGRSLSDLRSRIGLPALYYCGNHGLEIEGPGISFRHVEALSLKPVMQGAAVRIAGDLARVPGAVLENKELTLSVHYRRVPRAALGPLRKLRARLQIETSARPIRWGAGRKVWELVPEVPWHKGAASRYLMRCLRDPFPIALGDDTTDEDVFAALGGKGVAIRIGRPRASKADYYLGSQAQVARFLREAGAALDEAV